MTPASHHGLPTSELLGEQTRLWRDMLLPCASTLTAAILILQYPRSNQKRDFLAR